MKRLKQVTLIIREHGSVGVREDEIPPVGEGEDEARAFFADSYPAVNQGFGFPAEHIYRFFPFPIEGIFPSPIEGSKRVWNFKAVWRVKPPAEFLVWRPENVVMESVESDQG